ncbi:glycosyltransferase family 2 protein [Pedobacter duraquae]|uniref:Glycosyl transferase family 2 n=1 Tax=Pedobacter duraquae TaxID=425511 RepID=A0A4R6IGE3_9SPHI|nr:glycosyltransferase family 2 protein [Pedobacter duraquae]TDO21420.1 glycosyl transferase family 2 [Pedobacter duraquae]
MKISFVLLTWNRYKFLEKCLEALIPAIAHPEHAEIIVMDNGSTDNTPNVLARYASQKNLKVVTRKKNYGLNAYKKLFGMAKGEYVVIVDDDVLSFPKGLDDIFVDYMNAFPDYGFIALNVIQDKFTKGAKPPQENYTDDVRGDKIIEKGPTGGWCACFRKKQYNKVRLRFIFTNLDMKQSEDGLLSHLMLRRLKLKSGLIKNELCLHACGPHYAKVYGHMERELEKYEKSGLQHIVEEYKNYTEE